MMPEFQPQQFPGMESSPRAMASRYYETGQKPDDSLHARQVKQVVNRDRIFGVNARYANLGYSRVDPTASWRAKVKNMPGSTNWQAWGFAGTKVDPWNGVSDLPYSPATGLQHHEGVQRDYSAYKEVPRGNVYAGQDGVDPSRVAEIMDRPSTASDVRFQGAPFDTRRVYEHATAIDSEHSFSPDVTVINGHHRVAAHLYGKQMEMFVPLNVMKESDVPKAHRAVLNAANTGTAIEDRASAMLGDVRRHPMFDVYHYDVRGGHPLGDEHNYGGAETIIRGEPRVQQPSRLGRQGWSYNSDLERP